MSIFNQLAPFAITFPTIEMQMLTYEYCFEETQVINIWIVSDIS